MNAHDFYETWPQRIRAFRKAAPDTTQAFHDLFAATMKDGALAAREKELIAMAVAVALRCEPCIYSHVEKAYKAGNTREQILDAASVVVMMQGGPGYVYFPKVLEALDELTAKEQVAA